MNTVRMQSRSAMRAKNDVHRLALEYLKANISVIPVKLDGSKSPAIANWREVPEIARIGR